MGVKQVLGKMPLFVVAMGLLLGLAAWQFFAPSKTFSELENRSLAVVSAPSLATIRSGSWMKSAETAVADQFPFREQWVALQALEDAALLRTQRNGILIGRDGWLFERASDLNPRTAQENIAALGKIAAHTDLPVTLMLVPMSSAVYPGKLPMGYRADDQGALIASLYGALPNVETIDLLAALLAEESDIPLFYRTDHHWTLTGAMIAYDALREAWQLSEIDGPVEQLALPDGHYGSYFARAPNPFTRPDAFALAYPADVTLSIAGEPMPNLYDAEGIDTMRNKYAALLYGNHGIITLSGAAENGVLLVIKDSYANLLMPWLARHYRRVVAIDPRYYADNLQTWIQEEEEATILCIYGLTTWLTDRNLPRRVASW